MSQVLAIAGVGLIGGSVALALRRARPDLRIVGIDRDVAGLDDAIRRGVIDEAAGVEAVRDADFLLLAVPVGQMPAVFAAVAPHLSPRTVITDAGSTKQGVIAAARAALGDAASRFVPAHPIAGREHSGVAAATAELFEGKAVIIAPQGDNPAEAVEAITALWRDCGARVVSMPADAHDRVFAAVSHLPHLLAFALVDELAARPDARQLFAFAASGFRDFTRIAGSSPEMWRDIALANQPALLAELDRFLAHAGELRNALAAGDGPAMAALMARAQTARHHWMAGELDHFRDESA